MSVKTVFDSAIRLAEEKQALEKKVKALNSKIRKLQNDNRILRKGSHCCHIHPIPAGYVRESHPADGC